MNSQAGNAGFVALMTEFGVFSVIVGALIVWVFIAFGGTLAKRIGRAETAQREARREAAQRLNAKSPDSPPAP
ncbi:MAG: hypothetical protein SFX74_05275 [Fimbriimonadaceae bacterium]|nr:hypothetical protein [Fimbriimonadaceae bacterium]